MSDGREPKRGPTGRSISLPSSPFFYPPSASASASASAAASAAASPTTQQQQQQQQQRQRPRRQLSSALSWHLDRCMSAHSYHADAAAASASRRRRGQQQQQQQNLSRPWSPSSSSTPSVVAEALRCRARRLSFVDVDGEAAGPLQLSPEEEAAAMEAPIPPSLSPPPAGAASKKAASGVLAPAPRGTVLDGAAILFTAIASFPALSLPWSASTLGWAGVFAIGACGVATAFYSCWLMTYLIGVSRLPSPPKGEGKEGGEAADGVATFSDVPHAEESEGEEEEEDFRHPRYHDVAATILSKKVASRFVNPVQACVCGGICVVTMLIGGTTLKALSRILSPSYGTPSSSSPLRLPVWIAIYGLFQATSSFVPSLASSATVAIAGSVAFLVLWGLATAFSAVAGVEQQRGATPEKPFPPPGFYDLAATSTHEKAFAALNGLGVALFAWSNAFAPEVQATLRAPHDATMRKSTLAAFGLLTPTYCLIAALGYWAFGKETNVVVLLNLEPASLGGSGAGAESGSGSGSGVSSTYQAPRAALAVAWASVLVNLYALFAVYSFPIYEFVDAGVERWRTKTRRRRSKNDEEGEGASAAATAGKAKAGAEEAAVEAGQKNSSSSNGNGNGNGNGDNGDGDSQLQLHPSSASSPSSSSSSSASNVLAAAVTARLAGRIVFCAACTLVAAALPFFGDISAVLGVLTLALDFILPCLMFLRVRSHRMSRAAAAGLMGTAAFYVALGVAIMVAALRSLFMNAHTYKLFADV